MKIDESLKPDKAIMKLYFNYLSIVGIIIFVIVIVPSVIVALLYLSLFEALVVTISMILPFLGIFFFVAFWIPKYYASVSYCFTKAEIVIERGVWWKYKNTVPYNRVTNLDVVQGPLSRRLGLGVIRVQTAGYSGTGGGSGKIAEATIFGVKNHEEIKDVILNQVRGFWPVAVEAAAETPSPRLDEATHQMLAELRKIREILETR